MISTNIITKRSNYFSISIFQIYLKITKFSNWIRKGTSFKRNSIM